jgi:hypothetical protein
MSITIELSPETLARLQTKAAAEHLSVGDYIAELVTHNADDTNHTETALSNAVQQMMARTPEEKATQRGAILAASRPARALPTGKTLEDVVVGKWPGSETDAEINQALADLS